ncbi:hypothetical protein EB796_019951 [Bugula neritina]|uniref:Uncharacterized protein n=1 Tax=Bugula neritina TaxID=10212 RepID=A0A7J7J742_BUGNE|nr:hypothetical protein EB796_019951 [Bugula neritina]
MKVYERPCPHCPVELSLDNLKKYNLDYSSYPLKVVEFIVEDQFVPGQFYYNRDSVILKSTADGRVEHFVGRYFDDFTARYKPGNSTTAEFSPYILGLAQSDLTTFFIADYFNNCVRKFDLKSDYVSQFIGTCRVDNNSKTLFPGRSYLPDYDFLSGVGQILYLKQRDCLLMIDLHEYITVYSFATGNVSLLSGETSLLPVQEPRGMLANSDESQLYVTERFQHLSRIDLETYEVTFLIGQTANPFATGTLSSIDLSYTPILHWMVPDKLIVTVQIVEESLLFIDLVGGQAYSACADLKNLSQTVTGNLSSCVLNAPLDLYCVFQQFYLYSNNTWL